LGTAPVAGIHLTVYQFRINTHDVNAGKKDFEELENTYSIRKKHVHDPGTENAIEERSNEKPT